MPRNFQTEYLTKEQLEKLSTPRLLAYRKSLLTLPEWRCGPKEYAEHFAKEHARALAESKAILDTREHVEKPAKPSRRGR